MAIEKETGGKILFAALIVIFLACAILAYTQTGPMDIEGRFMHAVGLEDAGSSPGEDAGEPGFSLEGNPVAYIIIFLILIAVCWIAYRRFRP
ncbi:MAG: hypothetical protein ABFC71_11410 [Methanoregula sp.]